MTSYERMSCEHGGFTDYGTVTVETARLRQWLETHFHREPRGQNGSHKAKKPRSGSQPTGTTESYCRGSQAAVWVVGLTHPSIWEANNIH